MTLGGAVLRDSPVLLLGFLMLHAAPCTVCTRLAVSITNGSDRGQPVRGCRQVAALEAHLY